MCCTDLPHFVREPVPNGLQELPQRVDGGLGPNRDWHSLGQDGHAEAPEAVLRVEAAESAVKQPVVLPILVVLTVHQPGRGRGRGVWGGGGLIAR